MTFLKSPDSLTHPVYPLQQPELLMALFHSGNDDGVNFLVKQNYFTLAPVGTDR
jgi:hypothetical protein